MSERNAIKKRPCKLCGECVLGKASKLSEHARGCKQVHADAAAQAIMEKLALDMASPEAVLDKHWDMADEKVLDAEGD